MDLIDKLDDFFSDEMTHFITFFILGVSTVFLTNFFLTSENALYLCVAVGAIIGFCSKNFFTALRGFVEVTIGVCIAYVFFILSKSFDATDIVEPINSMLPHLAMLALSAFVVPAVAGTPVGAVLRRLI